MREADDAFEHDGITGGDAELDQVGTVDVQILLSWFFDVASPEEVLEGLPRAA